MTDSYWIDPYGKIIKVPKRHINLIIDVPRKFGFSEHELRKIYIKYKEPYGHEGKSREEIIYSLLNNGWMRLRYLDRNGLWTIQVDKLNKRKRDYIWDFAEQSTSGKLANQSPHTEFRVIDTNGNVLEYMSFHDAMAGKILEGKKTHNIEYVLFENYKRSNFMSFEKYLKEKSLSRLLQHMNEHDTGTITAYRSKKYQEENGKKIPVFSKIRFTKKENQQRNKSLLAKLQRLGYGVISVKGSYIENYKTSQAEEVGEHTFFVIDQKDRGNLETDLRKLGEEFEQDSILFIPKSGIGATLIGTNSIDQEAYPGYGKKENLGKRELGKSGEFFTKLGNSPFVFESVLREYNDPTGMPGRMACKIISEKNWWDIEL